MTLAALTVFAAAVSCLTNVAELARTTCTSNVGRTFDLTAKVTYACDTSALMGVEDASGVFHLMQKIEDSGYRPRPGDVARFVGTIVTNSWMKIPTAECTVTLVRHGSPVPPAPVEVGELLAGGYDNRFVSTRGTVTDSFQDEIDANWTYLVLSCSNETVFAVIPTEHLNAHDANALVDADVIARGLCLNQSLSARRMLGCALFLTPENPITVLRPAPDDPFAHPSLDGLPLMGAPQVLRLGKRRTSGRVLAVWGANRMLVAAVDGSLVGVETKAPERPQVGDLIEVCGFAETDLYRFNLSRAIWRKTGRDVRADSSALHMTARDIVMEDRGSPNLSTQLHGSVIRLEGLVKSTPAAGDRDGILTIESGGFSVPVDISSVPALKSEVAAGAHIRVTGVCIFPTNNWKPHDAFPHTEGFMIVVRTPADVEILARPPWWTPLRLLLVIGALILALLVLFVWNRILNRLVERRSRQLAKEEISRDLARLKTEERTRLAVELHDTIAQNLTGVALQLDAVELAAANDPSALPSRLTLTKQRLQNSREELRNVLWDLRSRAFEERLLSVAITRTIAPHVGAAKVDVDCDIPCRRLSDNAIHQILSIVRELVVNAVRHGEAKTVNISARLEDDRIALAVTDDGKGFDAQKRLGPESGHFGLQGLSERVHLLEGSFELTSSPGQGTVARLANLRTDI